MNPALPRLLQLADSQFPSGSFAHSGGLEGLLEARGETTVEELGEMLAAIWTLQTSPCDGIIGAAAYRAAVAGELEAIVALDRELLARKAARELREASVAIGRSFVEEAAAVFPRPALEAYRHRVGAREAPGNHAIAFHVAAAACDVDEAEAAVAFGIQSCAQMTSALMRLGRIGHRQAQRLLAALGPVVQAEVARRGSLDAGDAAAFAPLLEIASMRHERQYSRLFRS